MNLLMILLLWYADWGLPKWFQIFGTILSALSILCDTGAQALNEKVITIEKITKDKGEEDND